MNSRLLLASILIVCTLVSCELPESPDFTTSHKIEVPVIANKEFTFLGSGADVIIDTTGSEFDSLFTVDGTTGLISLSRVESFDFGDLNDAIPAVTVAPAAFDAQVGALSLGSFSSSGGAGGNLGSASFASLTGLNPAVVPAGTAIPGAMSPAPTNIAVNTDFFVSATISSGALEITLTNTLGFDLDQVNLIVNSGATPVGPLAFTNLNHGSTATESINFAPGTVLTNLNVDMTVTWSAQNTQAAPGSITVNDAAGSNLVASQIVAAIGPQSFETTGSSAFSNTEFRFENDNHFIQLTSGTISVTNIINQIDLGIDTLRISFPGIRSAPYGVGDSLIVEFSGPTAISRNGAGGDRIVDLSNHRIFANGNQVGYSIVARTEDSQSGAATARTITENDRVSATVAIEDLVIGSVSGVIVAQQVDLNTDEGADGNLDLFNDNEAEVTEIDGLESLSEQLDGLEFTQPALTIMYTTNIGIETEIIGAFVGTNGDGEQVFLSGNAGTPNEVLPADQITGFLANGMQLDRTQLVKFGITPAVGPGSQMGAVTFNSTNTNVADFLNNLPSDIRFVGRAAINPNEVEGQIANPVEFDAEISIDLPIAISTPMAATFSDTVDLDGDFPDTEDATEARVFINYTNGLPLGVDLTLVFFDDQGQEITRSPLAGETLIMTAGAVDPVTRFVNQPTTDALIFNLSREQLRLLGETEPEEILLQAALNTTNNSEVRLRAEDSIILSVSISMTIETDVD